MTAAYNTDPTRYTDEGYCVFTGVLAEQQVSAAREELTRSIAALPERLVVYKDGEHKEVASRPEYMTEPHISNDFWLQLCRDPGVLDAVASVLGDDLILIMSHLIVKRPHDGLPVAWHQDNTYWHSVRGTDVATVWLALDDTGLHNGCMQVIPRSHAGYPELSKVPTGSNDLLGLTVEVTEDMVSAAVPLEMSSGSLSIHDSYVIHGSDQNLSDMRRAAYTMRYANANTVSVDTAQHWVPVYLVRGEPPAGSEGYVDIR